jgi:preprotein translocase subunit YajC
MWISMALAQDAGKPAAGNDMLTGILPLVLIFVVFYFLLIRPQQKRSREHRELLSRVKKGDRVLTAGGVIGKVTKAQEGSITVEVEIAENVRVEVARGQIAGIWNPEAAAAPAQAASGAQRPANDAKPGLLKKLFGSR